ncbi:MAG TPA: FtsQ-type POTRA domain-containing protein [Candidatus Anaerotruncus excrementipullorum]|uniref:FtsQ-type POTRA domain-containing protein n=1 Tax=Candidatus Anaerotruncus excrementipullorum TaxID=2838465 RepID=A0A9D1WPC0_9FIRM|nr:FtsQ-type POTRA domain-containing protein [Candidatus Anaerotruncus excrementipullorum]
MSQKPPAKARERAGAAAVDQRRRRRRTGRQALHYLLILAVAAAIMAALSLTVFFKIETVEVTGLTKYAAEEVIQASGVQVGQNLFRVSEKKVNGLLTQQFPYIQEVTLKRSYPARLTLEVTQAQPLGAALTAAGYVLIGNNGRILEAGVDAVDPEVTIVTGMYLSDITEGRVLGTVVEEGEILYPADMEPLEERDEAGRLKSRSQLEQEEQARRQQAAQEEARSFQILTSLAQAISETSFGNITLVDFSDPLNMMVVYENRVIIELGSQVDLAYKLQFVQYVLEENLGEGFQGILDASTAASSKEVWSSSCNVQQELERRQLTMEAAQAAQQRPAADPNEGVTNPNLTVIPGSGASSGASSEAGTVQEEETSSSQAAPPVDPYSVIPNSSSEASSEAASQAGAAGEAGE